MLIITPKGDNVDFLYIGSDVNTDPNLNGEVTDPRHEDTYVGADQRLWVYNLPDTTWYPSEGSRIIDIQLNGTNLDVTGIGDAFNATVDLSSLLSGLTIKEEAQLATTGNITLSGEQTIDGVMTSTSRVLVKNQTDLTENGIYVSAAGAWTRATDFDTDPEVVSGAYVFVEDGTAQANTGWIVTTDDPISVGVDPIEWSQFSGAGETIAGDGLTKTGNTIDVVAGTGISVGANSVSTNDSQIVHNNLSGVSANEHVDHSLVFVSAGEGLSGGGAITSTVIVDVDITGSTDLPAPSVLDEILISDTDNGNAIRKTDVGTLLDLYNNKVVTLTNKSGNISQWTNDVGYITATVTTEDIQDAVGAMLSGNTETLITVTYNDALDKIDFVVDNDLGNYDATNLVITESQISDLDHYTSTDFDTDFAGKSTTDLTEGTNLYYTEVRVSANVDVAANTTHRTSDGSDHTFIDQDVTANSAPDFVNTNMTGNVSVWTNDAGYISDITAENFGDLNDVVITAIGAGEIFKWDGFNVVNNTLSEAGIAAAVHTHDAGAIVSGQFADARISQTSVLQYESNLTITEAQISDLDHYNSTDFNADFATKNLVDINNVVETAILNGELLVRSGANWINQTLSEAGISAVGHTHVAANITDFDTEVSNNADVAANTSARHTHANQAVLDATTASFTTGDETKIDFITVTQGVDLDQMESDIAALANGMVYKGDWDATTGVFPGGGTAQTGWFYHVSVGGTVDGISFNAGDNVVATVDNASTATYAGNWSKHDNTDAVQSVAGKVGAVTLAAADIISGTFANARISQSSVTQHQSAIDHDSLLNFVANEHLDWTADLGATNIHVGNITQAAVTQHEAALTITESQISDLTHTVDTNIATSNLTNTTGSDNTFTLNGFDWDIIGSTNTLKFHTDGRLGIGRDPAYLLDVAGIVNVGSVASAAFQGVRTENSGGNVQYGTISGYARIKVGTTDALTLRDASGEAWLGLNVVPSGKVFHFSNMAGTFDMVMNSSDGFVGVNTVSPTQQLDVDGSIRMRTGGDDGHFIVSNGLGNMVWVNPATIGLSEFDDDIGAGTSQNLSSVLTVGNDAGGLHILNGGNFAMRDGTFTRGGTDAVVEVIGLAGAGVIGTDTNDQLLIRTNNTNAITISTSQQVSINTIPVAASSDILVRGASGLIGQKAASSFNLSEFNNDAGFITTETDDQNLTEVLTSGNDAGSLAITNTGNITTDNVGSTRTIRAYSSAGDYSQLDGVGLGTSAANALIRPNADGVDNLHLGQAGLQYQNIYQRFSLNNYWYLGGTDVMTLNSTGLGIDTTPSGKLDIKYHASAGVDRHFYFPTGNTDGPKLQRKGDTLGWAHDYGFLTNDGTDVGGFGAHGSDTAVFRYWIGTDYLNPVMTIQPGGNVGVGTITPDYIIQAEKSSSSGTTGVFPEINANNPNTTGFSFGAISATANDVTAALRASGGSTQPAFTYNLKAGAVGTFTNHPFVFYANNDAKAIILPTGEFGIGTSVPASILHTQGGGGILHSLDGSFDVGFINGTGGQLWLTTKGSTAAQAKRISITGAVSTPTIEFWRGNSGAEEQTFAINTVGQLRAHKYGVGTFTTGTAAYFSAYDASGNILEKPMNLSEFNNDVGFITTETDDQTLSEVLTAGNNAGGIGAFNFLNLSVGAAGTEKLNVTGGALRIARDATSKMYFGFGDQISELGAITNVGTADFFIGGAVSNDIIIANQGNSVGEGLKFGHLSGGVFTQHAIIDYTGKVGIGGAAGTEIFKVYGKIIQTGDANNGFMVVSDAAGTMQWTDPATINLSSFNDDLTHTVDTNIYTTDGTVTNRTVTLDGDLTFLGNAGEQLYLTNTDTSSVVPRISIRGKASNTNSSAAYAAQMALSGWRSGGQVTNGKVLGAFIFGGNHTDATEANIKYTSSITAEASGNFSAITTMPTDLVFRTGDSGQDLGTAGVNYGDTESFRIRATGQLAAPEYGVGAFTGTLAYTLGVTAAGDIIEVADCCDWIETKDPTLGEDRDFNLGGFTFDFVGSAKTITVSSAGQLGVGNAPSEDVDIAGNLRMRTGAAAGTVMVGSSTGVGTWSTKAAAGISEVGHVHAAADVTTGTFATARIPNLATSKITSGTFADARIAASNVTQYVGSIDHDALLNFVANEHIDWTADQGATNIHAGNITEGSVTQHQSALSITESQISDLQNYIVSGEAVQLFTVGTRLTLSKFFNIAPQSSPPTSPNTGDVYLDDGTNYGGTSKGFRYFNGASWEDLGRG